MILKLFFFDCFPQSIGVYCTLYSLFIMLSFLRVGNGRITPTPPSSLRAYFSRRPGELSVCALELCGDHLHGFAAHLCRCRSKSRNAMPRCHCWEKIEGYGALPPRSVNRSTSSMVIDMFKCFIIVFLFGHDFALERRADFCVVQVENCEKILLAGNENRDCQTM